VSEREARSWKVGRCVQIWRRSSGGRWRRGKGEGDVFAAGGGEVVFGISGGGGEGDSVVSLISNAEIGRIVMCTDPGF